MMKVLLEYMIAANISIVFLVVIISLLKLIFKNRISHNVYYVLWFLVLLRIVVFWGVPSIIDIGDLLFEASENNYEETMANAVTGEGETQNSQDLDVLEDRKSDIGIQADIDVLDQSENGVYSRQKTLDVPLIPEEFIDGFIDSSWLTVFWAIYLMVAFILILIPISSWIVLKKDYSYYKAETEMTSVLQELDRVKHYTGIHKDIRILFASDVTRPGLIGVLKPLILLPENFREMDLEELSLVLRHEVMHVGKRHMLFQWAAWFLKALNWMNPLVWLSHELMKREAELWCDDEVAKLLTDSQVGDYGHLIVDLAVNKVEPVYQLNVIGLGNNNQVLKDRIYNITDDRKPLIAVGGLMVVLVIILLFGNSYDYPWTQESPEYSLEITSQPIVIENVIELTPVSGYYKDGEMNVVYNYRLLEELIKIEETFSSNPTQEKTLPMDNLYIRLEIEYSASGVEDIRNGYFHSDLHYMEEEDKFMLTTEIKEGTGLDYEYNVFGPSYVRISYISLRLYNNDSFNMTLKDRGKSEVMDIEGLGLIQIQESLISDESVGIKLVTGDNPYDIHYFLTVLEIPPEAERHNGSESGDDINVTAERIQEAVTDEYQVEIHTIDYKFEDMSILHYPLTIQVEGQSISFIESFDYQTPVRQEIREGGQE